MGFTYTSPPILADGTEISVRFFWNSYRENPATNYWAGDLFDFEFALTERIGRFQVGVTGFFAFQVEDDELLGVPIPPDGRRVKSAWSHSQLRHAGADGFGEGQSHHYLRYRKYSGVLGCSRRLG